MPDQLFENIMIHTWEIMPDIALKHIIVVSYKMRGPIDSGMRSFAFPTGVRIIDE